MRYLFKRARGDTRRRAARGLAGALGATAVAIALLAAAATPASVAATRAPARPALTAESFDLTSGLASFSSGGHTWQLQVMVDGGQSTTQIGTNAVTFGISTPYLGGTETHEWNATTFAPAKDFSLTSSGGATFSTGSFFSPVAAFSLKFAPTSHTAEACVTGKGTVYKGTLSGEVSLNTGLHGVGVSKKLTFKGTELTVNVTCVPPEPCGSSLWEAGGTSATSVLIGGYELGTPGKTVSYASIGKADIKTASKVLDLADGADIKAPPPTFDSSTKTLTVSASASGILTGAGKIAHAIEPVKPEKGTCSLDGQEYTETLTFYAEGKFTASKPFVARTLLTSKLTAPKSAPGGFEIVTLKKK
jgi:hypothetical protein